MTKSDFDEILVQLYLRLNGYFTTSLILHSPSWGENRTEIDCVAIRHGFHNQPDRIVTTSDFLSIENYEVDILFCEVKHDPTLLKFNNTLKTDAEAIRNILRWIGIFQEDEINNVAKKLMPIFQEDVSKPKMLSGIVFKNFRIRPLLCCPTVFDYKENKWCLTGREIIEYVQKCLNPLEKRESCSTRYNFQQWGFPFYKIVKYLKDCEPSNQININDLYNNIIKT